MGNGKEDIGVVFDSENREEIVSKKLMAVLQEMHDLSNNERVRILSTARVFYSVKEPKITR